MRAARAAAATALRHREEPGAAPAMPADDSRGEPDDLDKPPAGARFVPDVISCSRSARPAPPPMSLEEEDSDSSGFESFESLSRCSSEKLLASRGSDTSEIPEAILEESSSEDEGLPRADVDTCDLPRPVVVNAWVGPTTSPASPRPLTVGGSSAPPGGSVAEVASAALGGVARTPVRRARVRGTICLPTSARGEPPTPPPQPSTAAARRPLDAAEPRCDFERNLPMPGEDLAAERARLEAERERAALRVLASEEALAAERAIHEAELARQAREAADRQAILQALNHDHTELAALYREAHQELSRLRAELSERTVEVLELRQAQERLRRDLSSQSSRNTCVVCLDAPATMASLPCGHLALCEACVVQLDRLQCPVCRHASSFMIHIFTP